MIRVLGLLVMLVLAYVGSHLYFFDSDETKDESTLSYSEEVKVEKIQSEERPEVDEASDTRPLWSLQKKLNKSRLTSSQEEVFYTNQYFDTTSKGQILLLAEVASPIYNLNQLQASDIYLARRDAKTYIYASYNIRGADFIGAVQILRLDDDGPKLLQTTIFKDTDIHNISIKQDTLYIAGASADESLSSPAVVEIRSLKDNIIDTSLEGLRVDLPSYAATSVSRVGRYVVATVGAVGGGVAIVDTRYLSNKFGIYRPKDELKFFDFPDARSLSVDRDFIYALRGTDAAILKLNRKSLADPEVIQLEGATIAEAKSTILVRRDRAFLALSDGGASVFDLKKNKVITHIPVPVVKTLDEELTTTNSISGSYRRIVTADGEAGAHVYILDRHDKVSKTASIRFQAGVSINSVAYYRGYIIMASGSGGIKIAKYINMDNDSLQDEESFFDEIDAIRASEF